MALAPGSRIGPYRIVAPLGAGGMGEVWRATDANLGRDVAIKVLPDTFAHDPERLVRFEREARTLAALNHAHIAALYGVEDAGVSKALVMELVEGPTLADVLATGPMAVDEALAMARQVADALSAAHEQGIVHRDLKPANIKLRPDGTVKVLDFGLARAMEPAAAPLSPGVSQSPTLTSPAMTQAGVILGTAAYMSPEQVKGRPVDKRSDVWAFGCVLYEALTGRRVFDAPDVPETLAAVLTREPDWRALPAALPPPVQALLHGCLVRDRQRRVGDMAAALFALDHAGSPSAAANGSTASATSHVGTPRAAMLLFAAAASLAAFVTGGAVWRQPDMAAPTARFAENFPDDGIFTNTSHRQIAFSADGTQIVFRANSQLYQRPIGSLESAPIPGSVDWDPLDVAFAPDGRSLAFFSRLEGAVMRMPLTGGTPTKIGPIESPLGMSWDGDNILVGQGSGGVLRLRAGDARAAPEQIVTVGEDEIAAFPQMLPGGDAVMFTLATMGPDAAQRWDRARIVVRSLTTDDQQIVVEGGADARYLPTGHLLYAVAGTLFARPFDVRTRRADDPVPVVRGIRRSAETGVAHYTTSASGALLYVPGATTWTEDLHTFVVVDAAGAAMPLPVRAGAYDHPRVSGSRLVYQQDDRDIWVYDLASAAEPRRLTLEGRNRYPIWAPDGRVAFQSDRGGDRGIWVQRVDGLTPAARVTTAEDGEAHIPESWSPDGRTLLYSVQRGSRFTLWLRREDGTNEPFGNVVSSGGPPGAVFSPDGQWVAYGVHAVALTADRANRGIFVQPFPATGVRHQVTRSRLDFHPAWAPDGETLFYLPSVLEPIVAIPVRRDTGDFSGRPVSTLVRSRQVYTQMRGYDILPDGRFLTMVGDPSNFGSATTPGLHWVLNWFEELKELVPPR